MSLWDSVVDTVESLGGAAIAPAGAVWDVATAGFDDKDDTFGTVLNKVANRASQALDPLINEETLTGFGFSKTMQGLEYIYREGVSEPIVSGSTMLGHVAADPVENWDDIFSGAKWGEAYEVAQTRSIGQARLLSQQALFGTVLPGETVADPFEKRAYEQINKQSPVLTTLSSGTTDFFSRWYLDPGVVLGKAAMGVKAAKTGRKITPQDHFKGIQAQLADEHHAAYGARPFGIGPKPDNLATRTEKYLSWLDTGADGGRMNATQIYVGSPELRRSAAGKQIAGLLEQAGKIGDEAVRRDTQRHILAVAYGDTDAIFKAENQLAEFTRINDELKNIAKGSVVDLKATVYGDHLLASPELMAHLQGQLDNMPEVKRAVSNHVKRLELLVGQGRDDAALLADDAAEEVAETGVAGTLKAAPRVSGKGKRAVAREQGHGLLRDGKAATGHGVIDKPLTAAVQQAQKFADHPALSTVYQASPTSVPLRIVSYVDQFGLGLAKFGGKAALGYARAPQKAMDALRTTHLNGMANLHDWNGSTTQLDAMMKQTGVQAGRRMELLSKAFMARTESEKMRIIEDVEHDSLTSLAATYSEKLGEKIDKGFIQELVTRGNAQRASWMAPRRGRIYAATKMEADPLRDPNVDKLADAAHKWRVDEVNQGPEGHIVNLDEQGIPIAMPLLETQLANIVPLVDTALAKKALKREAGTIAKKARAWKNLRYEADRLARLKSETGANVDDALRAVHGAQDWLVRSASTALRVWKMSVLMRLGYPMRVVADDHMRIWSQIGAAAVLAPMFREVKGNVKYNQIGRRAEVRQELAGLRAERAQLLDSLDEGVEAAWKDRDEQIRSLNRRISALKGASTRAGEKFPDKASAAASKAEVLTAERDTLQAMQGQNPTATRKRIAEIEARIDQGSKALRKEKRKKRLGERDIVMADGTVYRGAFAGPSGDAMRNATSSHATWDNNMRVGEERLYQGAANDGNWGVVQPGGDAAQEAAHLTAWTDVLNNQFRQSQVAMHFINGGTVDDFVVWLKEPAQKQLRERLSHYAHDPEDWGWRVKQLVDNYLGTDEIRDAVKAGRVTPNELKRLWPDMHTRPEVHGATIAHNLGMSTHARTVGATMNRIMHWLGSTPTDQLSRHPYFAAVYKSELNEIHVRNMAVAKREGRTHLTNQELRKAEAIARKNALADLKRTLFDMEAHSNAAHVMRFVSPFFAAHQEAISRWWRIISDDPSIVRKAILMFDMPKKLGLVVDEDGEQVPYGAMPGPGQYLLLQVPEAFGGNTTDPTDPDFVGYSDKAISLNSFNFVLQNGSPLNPGTGPLLQMPTELLVEKYAQYEDIEKVARLMNPYQPRSTGDIILPSVARRVWSLVRQEKSGEFMYMFQNNLDDAIVQWRMENGFREPTKAERAKILAQVKDETQVEAWFRLGQNALSPFPASPRSKFAVIRAGYQKLWDQARAEGRDFDWVSARFKELYGSAYLPLMQSASNNEANIPVTNEAVAARQRHRGLLEKIDPQLHGAIIGPEAGDESEYSQAAARYFREEPVLSGSDDTYLTYDDPLQAFTEGAVKRGWSVYGDAMDALQAMAVDNGLASWRDSDYLVELRKRMVANLGEQNEYWAQEYNAGFSTPAAYDAVLKDLRTIAGSGLANDPARGDVKVLQQYLKLREIFTQALAIRAANGGPSTMEAEANADLRKQFAHYVGILEESNTYFQRHYGNSIISRDPYLQEAN